MQSDRGVGSNDHIAFLIIDQSTMNSLAPFAVLER